MLSPVGAGKHSSVCPGLTFTAFQLLLHGTSASEGLLDGWLGRREIQTANYRHRAHGMCWHEPPVPWTLAGDTHGWTSSSDVLRGDRSTLLLVLGIQLETETTVLAREHQTFQPQHHPHRFHRILESWDGLAWKGP